MLPLSIILDSPAWFILLCLLLGAGYAALLYFQDRGFKYAGEGKKRWLPVLALFRFITVSTIAFLLLAPLLSRSMTKEEPPVIVLAHDNSASIGLNLSPEDSLAYRTELNTLIAELKEKFDLQVLSFDTEVYDSLKLDYDGATTNLALLNRELFDRYTNQNIGAVILASDGIFNEGANPLYLNRRLQTPFYTIGLGDTTSQRDLKISRTYHNKIVYLNDRFNLKVDYQAYNLAGKNSRMKVYQVKSGRLTPLFDEAISLSNDYVEGNRDFVISVKEPGLQQYRIVLNSIEGEVTTANNVSDVFVEVLDARQQVLILAHAPHPDLAAFKQAIETNLNYQATIEYARKFRGQIKEYDVVILHQLPSRNFAITPILNTIKEDNIPHLMVLGSQSDFARFNKAQKLVKLTGANGSFNESGAVVEQGFTLFNFEENIAKAFTKFPPINSPFGKYEVAELSSTLLTQKIGSVKSGYPLLIFSQVGDQKQAILCGEGFWRWRLHDHLESTNHDRTNLLVSQMIQYLSVKADKRQFRTSLNKNVLSEKESIVIDAELYNDSYELVNDPEVKVTIKDEEGKDYPYIFNRTQNAYTLRPGSFPEGNYTYSASVTYNSKNMNSSGRFTITPIRLEALQTKADHGLLYQLSDLTGGLFYVPGQLSSLKDQIINSPDIKPLLRDSRENTALIDLKWVFFLLLGFLSIEWFLRKWWGGY